MAKERLLQGAGALLSESDVFTAQERNGVGVRRQHAHDVVGSLGSKPAKCWLSWFNYQLNLGCC